MVPRREPVSSRRPEHVHMLMEKDWEEREKLNIYTNDKGSLGEWGPDEYLVMNSRAQEGRIAWKRDSLCGW